MTKTIKKVIVSCLFIAISIAAFFSLHTETYKAVYFKSGSGWGYGIYKHDKLFILQPIIPCIAEKKTFHSKVEAQKVGNCVLDKLNNNQQPILLKEEVIALLR